MWTLFWADSVRELAQLPWTWWQAVAKLGPYADHRALPHRQAQPRRMPPTVSVCHRQPLRAHLDTRFQDGRARQNVLMVFELAPAVQGSLVPVHRWRRRGRWPDLTRLLGEAVPPPQLLAWEPRWFQFSDAALALVLHGVNSVDVEQSGIAGELHQALSLALHRQQDCSTGPVARWRLSVFNACGSQYVTAAQALHDASLQLQKPMPSGEMTRFFHQPVALEQALDAELLAMVMHWIDTDTPPLAYQPKCGLRSCEVKGAEALLRAQDGQQMHIEPARVLALAARHQLLAALEWCIIKAVVRDAQWFQRQAPDVLLAVNMSGASLSTPDFAQRVKGLLQAAGLPPHSITLELTESSPLPRLDAVTHNLRQFQAWGIPLSLDDFGSGYSGLSLLGQYPFAELKIDHAMVAKMDSPRMKSAIQLALESAQRYDARFVAEGVETQAQCDTLSAMGIGLGQGYLFAPALRLEELLSFIRKARGTPCLA